MGWGENLAEKWTRMVGPSRPTISELYVYTKYAHQLMKKKSANLDLLVLGSTPEFRDWGYEENMNVTVMDYSRSYHRTISKELRHKDIVAKRTETVLFDKWQNLDFSNKFDIIIGDLVIGNISHGDLSPFLQKCSNALKKDGLFLGKSFFPPRNYKIIDPKQLVEDYYCGTPWHPYSAFAFDLSMYVRDNNGYINFKEQYEQLEILLEKGVLKKETLNSFVDVGWKDDMHFGFYVPEIDEYESALNKYFIVDDIEYGIDCYSVNFPLYIARKQ